MCLNIVFHFRNEQAFLISLTGLRSEKYFWIGLSDTEEQGTFRWTSGEAPLFTHWNSAMPGKLCMGTSLVIRVSLKFKQVSAFQLLILEIRAGTFVFTAVGDQHCQILFAPGVTYTCSWVPGAALLITCEVVEKHMYPELDQNQQGRGLNKVHGSSFSFNVLNTCLQQLIKLRKMTMSWVFDRQGACVRNGQQMSCSTAFQQNIWLETVAFSVASYVSRKSCCSWYHLSWNWITQISRIIKVIDSPFAVNVNKIKCYLSCDLPGVGKMRNICILNPFLGKVGLWDILTLISAVAGDTQNNFISRMAFNLHLPFHSFIWIKTNIHFLIKQLNFGFIHFFYISQRKRTRLCCHGNWNECWIMGCH